MTMRKCGTCQHMLAGQCYRFPPKMVLWPSDNQPPVMYAPYPTRPGVNAETPACGEWKKDDMR